MTGVSNTFLCLFFLLFFSSSLCSSYSLFDSSLSAHVPSSLSFLFSHLLCIRHTHTHHNKALYFPDQLEERLCALLLGALKVATDDPNQAPAHSWERPGRRCVEVLTGCLRVAAFDAPRCASLAQPTLQLASKWFDGDSSSEAPPNTNATTSTSTTAATTAASVDAAGTGANANATGGAASLDSSHHNHGGLPRKIADRPEDLCKVVRGFNGLAGRVTAAPDSSSSSNYHHNPQGERTSEQGGDEGVEEEESSDVPLFETLLTFLLTTIESAGGTSAAGGGRSGPVGSASGGGGGAGAQRLRDLEGQRAQLLGEGAVALTLLHCQKLSAVKRQLALLSSESALSPPPSLLPPSLSEVGLDDGASASFLATAAHTAALEELEGPTTAVLSCLLSLCANTSAWAATTPGVKRAATATTTAAAAAAKAGSASSSNSTTSEDLPSALVALRCLKDLACSYPDMFQELQVFWLLGICFLLQFFEILLCFL